MILLRPQDYFGGSAAAVRSATGAETALAIRLLKLGTALALGCGVALLLALKIGAWWSHRAKKGAGESGGKGSA
jgi:hypothetical protein